MTTLRSAALLLALTIPLRAQDHETNEHQLGAYKGHEQKVRLAMDYCDATDDFAAEHQPRIYAKSASTAEGEAPHWKQFANRAEWEAAERPTPLAFVWDRDGTTVGVTVLSNPPCGWNPLVASRRTEYCYSTDAKLVRIRAIWYVPTRCEFLFPCQLIRGHEDFLLQRPGITDWVLMPDGQIRKIWNGETADDYFDPSHWLSVSDLHIRTSDDLPFNRAVQSK